MKLVQNCLKGINRYFEAASFRKSVTFALRTLSHQFQAIYSLLSSQLLYRLFILSECILYLHELLQT